MVTVQLSQTAKLEQCVAEIVSGAKINFQKVSLEINGNIGIHSKTYKKCLWKINGNIGINSKSVSEISPSEIIL